jgi:acyl-CoA reductase-like NAD-dependent aldehyde dehydrogenase
MSLETLTTISPSTNKPILKRNGLSTGEVATLCENAVTAFKSFKQSSLAERQKIVKSALKLLENKQDELAKELTDQMGRPIAYTAKEVKTAVVRGEYLLKISEETLADTPGESEKGFNRFIKKVPVGPVLIIFAWNVSPPSHDQISSGRF